MNFGLFTFDAVVKVSYSLNFVFDTVFIVGCKSCQLFLQLYQGGFFKFRDIDFLILLDLISLDLLIFLYKCFEDLLRLLISFLNLLLKLDGFNRYGLIIVIFVKISQQIETALSIANGHNFILWVEHYINLKESCILNLILFTSKVNNSLKAIQTDFIANRIVAQKINVVPSLGTKGLQRPVVLIVRDLIDPQLSHCLNVKILWSRVFLTAQ